ncbi:CHAT domain-containing protein [Roseiconus lacunae]|uniref:CHAT domain-containing protein n=1 Tax=Roseiconus lacunae TaxID=2605694 RepID=A0ABT7PLJ5_9BACT|nr:CHAT domain-containing protein [Roseiconus lacunae]MDM4017198.1 CHAT domain-containing protein [Roseiconus lacunae]
MYRPLVVSLLVLCSGWLTPAVAQEATIDATIKAVRGSVDSATLATLLSASAEQHVMAQRWQLASERVDEAIGLAIKNDDENALKSSLMTAGKILNHLRGDAGNEFYLSLLKKVGDKPKLRVTVLKTLGQQLLSSGDVVASIGALQAAYAEVKSSSPNSEEAFWVGYQYGQACVLGRLFDLGLPALKEARMLAIELGRNDLASYTNLPIGNACLTTGEYELAEDVFSKQLQLAIESGEQAAIDQAIFGAVSVLLRRQKLETVESLLNKALAGGDEADDANRLAGKSMAQTQMAQLAIANGNPGHAAEWADKTAASKIAMFPFLMRFSVGAQSAMMDRLAAAAFYQQAGNSDAAIEAADLAEKGYQHAVRQAQSLAKQGIGNLDATLTAYSEIPSSLSAIRQQILVDANRSHDALIESERGRSQAQIDAMRRNFELAPDDTATLTLEQIRELARQENCTFVEYSVIHPLDYFTRTALGSRYAISRSNKLFIWVIQPSGEIQFKQVTLDRDLSDLVKQARDVVYPPKPQHSNNTNNTKKKQTALGAADAATEGPDAVQRLSRILIAPIENWLPEQADQEVVVVPHRELFAIPFAALTKSNGDRLIQQHTIVHAASIGAYKLSASRRGTAGKLKFDDILVVGNPKMPSYQSRPDKPAVPLSELPGAEREAKAIAQMLGITPLLGELAKESEVRSRMKLAPVIHLASHGLLEGENVLSQPYLSAIALTPDEKENGFLTVSEIMRMSLEADMTVLSACDSGRGKISGEGVVGLSRGYLSAGVPTVVVSLWPVNDQATAFLMVHFYDALKKGATKSAALRAAMLATREKFDSPKLWAPFTLYGVGH